MKFKVTINEDPWTIELLAPDIYELRHGTDSKAITDDNDRFIHFNVGYLTLNVIKHEVHHAYWSYLCLDDVETFTPEQMSEITAVFTEKYGEKELNKAKEIYKRFTKK